MPNRSPLPNRTWRREIAAIVRKEYRTEMRSQAGLLAGSLFSVMAVFSLSVAAFNNRLTGGIAAGLLWVALLFATVLAVPRRFTAEEESGTADQLRLWARPHSVFWGKALFSLLEVALTAAILSALFFMLSSAQLQDPVLFLLGIGGSTLALVGATSVTGAMAAPAANRTTLAAALALPLLSPVIFWGVAALRASMGEGNVDNAYLFATGLFGYGIASVAVGPYLYAAVWKP